MHLSSKERGQIAELASRLYGQLWRGEAFTLPEGAPAYLDTWLQTTQRVLGTLVPQQRCAEVYDTVSELMTTPGFAGAIKQAEDGSRSDPGGKRPALFHVNLPGGGTTGVSFASGKDLMATGLFQIAGVGRRRKSQTARQKQNARRAEQDQAEAKRCRAKTATGTPAAKPTGGASTQQFRVVLAGPMAALLRIVRSTWR